MTILRKFFSAFTFLLVFSLSYAQTLQLIKSQDNSLYYAKHTNGLNAIIEPVASSGNVQTTVYVKTGTVYENDSVSGIAYILQNIISDKIAVALRKGQKGISFQNTSLLAYTTTELSVFQLTSSTANYEACLQLLRDSVFTTLFYEDEIKNKIEDVRKEIRDGKTSYKTEYETKLLERIYRKDARKQILVGDTSGAYPYIDKVHILRFHEKYYLPNNTIITAKGNIDANDYQSKLAEIFKSLIKGKFDREAVSKIIDFKPMLYTTQFVVNAPIEQPQFEICWQFPGARSNVNSSYYAFLLSAMLNDPNNYIQVKAKKLGCKKFIAEYSPSNFSGIFKVVIQPDKQHLFETYEMVLTEMGRVDETLVNESMMKVGMLNFQKEYDAIKNSTEYVDWITKYWIYDDPTYFTNLKDSVFLLGERRMVKFVIEYIKQSAHVTGLQINETDRAEFKIDSLLPELNPDVANYVFHYRPNITYLEGAENLAMQTNLLRWLTINPDLTVQINGRSDKTEFGKAKDDSIMAFIDSIPTFAKVKKDIVRMNALRPEMMRAMKIIKYLYDNGIPMERIKGTSMPFSSKYDKEALENMVCTITLDKMRNAPSVYEYHYGIKKEQPTINKQ